jgi:hypothetical protein
MDTRDRAREIRIGRSVAIFSPASTHQVRFNGGPDLRRPTEVPPTAIVQRLDRISPGIAPDRPLIAHASEIVTGAPRKHAEQVGEILGC